MEKISFKHLDGWLKTVVILVWISVGFTALSIVGAILSIFGELAGI